MAAVVVCLVKLLIFVVTLRGSDNEHSVNSLSTDQLQCGNNKHQEIDVFVRISGLYRTDRFGLTAAGNGGAKTRGRRRKLSAPILRYSTFYSTFRNDYRCAADSTEILKCLDVEPNPGPVASFSYAGHCQRPLDHPPLLAGYLPGLPASILNTAAAVTGLLPHLHFARAT